MLKFLNARSHRRRSSVVLEEKEQWILSSTFWKGRSLCCWGHCLNMTTFERTEIIIIIIIIVLFDAWKNGFSDSFLPLFFAIWHPLLPPLFPIKALRDIFNRGHSVVELPLKGKIFLKKGTTQSLDVGEEAGVKRKREDRFFPV